MCHLYTFIFIYLAAWFGAMSLASQDWVGWLIALVVGHIGVAVGYKILGIRLGTLLAVSVCLRFVLALISSYYDPQFAGVGDFFEFHSSASQIAETKLMSIKGGSDFFRHTLATAYYIAGESYFLAHILSLCSFIVSFFVFIGIFKNLYPSRSPFIATAIYSLLPSQVFFGTMPLREQHQILLTMALVWLALIYLKSPRLLFMAGIGLIGFVLALSHKAFSVIAVAIIAVTILAPLFFGAFRLALKKSHMIFALIAGGGLLVGVYILLNSGFSGMAPLSSLIHGGIDTYIRKTWTLNTTANASYQFFFDLDSEGGKILSAAKACLYYLFYPFPWVLKLSPRSLYGAAEAVLRMSLILGAVAAVLRSKGEVKSKIILLLVFYCIFTIIWSLGTINYGTAMRHNLTHQWIILIVGTPIICDVIRNRLIGLRKKNLTFSCKTL